MRFLQLLKIGFLAFLGSGVLVNTDSSSFNFMCDAPTHPDYAPLMAIYNATDGPNWNNNDGWGVDCDVCNWDLVSCQNNRVTFLDLPTNNLSNQLPVEIGLLDSLEILRMQRNNLTGELPSSIGNLKNLKEFQAGHNQISSAFPEFIFDLESLELLGLSNNQIEGNVPDKFDLLPKLIILSLSVNNLTGPIPSTIYGLGDLTNLAISNNGFTGGFLDEFAGLSSLKILTAINTTIGGELPPSIGLASQLESINLANSYLTGELPESLYNLDNLGLLQLQNNSISGEISSSISGLTSLYGLNLSGNSITGGLPASIGALSNLRTLNLQQNLISGLIPEELYTLSSLTSLNVSQNMLEGPISQNIGNLVNLTTLSLSRNDLGGEIPIALNNLKKLRFLSLTDIQLSGEITNQFDDLDELVSVQLGENNLSGSFPAVFSELPSLTTLNLSNNLFTDCFPSNYSDFCSLTNISLQRNCTFLNPSFSEFCAGAVCNNSLNLSAPVIEVCAGETFTIESPSGYTGYEWSVPGQTSRTLNTQATSSQYYYITITNFKGCTKSDSLYIEVLSNDPGTEYAEICPGDDVTINGEPFNQIGEFNQTIPRPGSCDSTVIVTISQAAGTTGNYSETICPGTTTTINGGTFGPGTSTQTISNQAGCDSIINIEIDEYPVYSENLEFSVCAGTTYAYEGQQLAVGSHVVPLATMNGCDSIINIEIDEYPTYSENLEFSVCAGSTYTYEGQQLAVGSHVVPLATVNGCDSIINIEIGEYPIYSENLEFNVCAGGLYSYEGQDLIPGFHVIPLLSISGCDSLININVLEDPADQTSLSEIICQGQSYPVGSQSFSTTGEHLVELTNQAGCDSIVTLNLTVISGEDQTIEVSICEGDSYSFVGNIYTENTIVEDSVIIEGCRSLTTLNLTVLEPAVYEFYKTACDGEAEYFFGEFLEENGSYEHELNSSQNCDSLIIMHLEFAPNIEVSVDTFLCEGSSLFYEGHFYSETGTVRINGTSMAGCDSTTFLNIELYEKDLVLIEELVCEGDSILFEGDYYTAGAHTGSFFDGNCDVPFELLVSEVDKVKSSETLILCEGQYVEYLGKIYNEAGQYLLNQDINECEFIEYLTVLETSSEETVRPQVLCEGAVVEINGKEIVSSGTYELSSESECSNEYISILFVSGHDISIHEIIEEGDTYVFNGIPYNESGLYEIVIGDKDLCPTQVLLDLTVQSCNGQRVESATICEGESIMFFDQEISESGTYEYLKPLEIGCDSIVSIEVTKVDEITFEIMGQDFICEGEEIELSGPSGYEYMWSNGSTERQILTSEGGVFELTIFDENYCPSFQNLTVEEINFPLNEDMAIVSSHFGTCAEDVGRILIYLQVDNYEDYLFSIDGGVSFQASNEFTGLPIGRYEVQMSDLNQRCTKLLSDNVILESEGVPEIENIEIEEINDCKGQLGSITIIPEDSNENYIYSIDEGVTWSESPIFEELDEGSYIVQMKVEGSACVNNLSQIIDLDNIGNLEAEVSILNHLSCVEASDGKVIIEILEGQPPYTFTWSDGQIGPGANNLGAGTYQVTVSDANACSNLLEVSIEAPEIASTLDVFQDAILCAGETISYEVDTNFTYVIFKDDVLYYSGNEPVISEVGVYQVISENGPLCVLDKYFEVEAIDLGAFGVDFLISTEGVQDVEIIAVNISDPMPDNIQWQIDAENFEIRPIDQNSQGILFLESGTFNITLLSEIDGCLSSLSKEIVIYPDSTYLGTYEVPDPPLDYDRFGSWEVFPNPNNGQFQVSIQVSSRLIPIDIAIYDIYGARLDQRRVFGSFEYLEDFHLANAGSGVYMVVLSALGKQFQKNILVVK